MAVSKPVDLTTSLPDGTLQTPEITSTSTVKVKKKKASVLPVAAFLPPCRVCNATASGYHYGANTCEACKAFFRRSIRQGNDFKPCVYGRKCADNPNGKVMCPDCRYRKCVAIGMARAGCRKGRYTYEKRTQDTKEVRRMQADVNAVKNFEVQQCAETVTLLTTQFEQTFPELYAFLTNKGYLDCRIHEMIGAGGRGQRLMRPLYAPGHAPNPEAMMWYETFNTHYEQSASHPDTYEEFMGKTHDMVFNEWASETERNSHLLATYFKSLPGFSDLLLNDQIILLKQGRVDMHSILKHKHMYLDIKAVAHYVRASGDLFVFPMLILRKIAGDTFCDCMDSVNYRLQCLNLTIEDIAVLLAFAILMSDREGLQRTDQVEMLQDRMLLVLQYCLQKNHPDKPNILADTLLLLPLLRENSEVKSGGLDGIRSRLKAETTPLLSEILQL